MPGKDFITTNTGTPFSDIPGLIFIKKNKEKQITEKVISISKTELSLDLFKIPKEYKYFEGKKL